MSREYFCVDRLWEKCHQTDIKAKPEIVRSALDALCLFPVPVLFAEVETEAAPQSQLTPSCQIAFLNGFQFSLSAKKPQGKGPAPQDKAGATGARGVFDVLSFKVPKVMKTPRARAKRKRCDGLGLDLSFVSVRCVWTVAEERGEGNDSLQWGDEGPPGTVEECSQLWRRCQLHHDRGLAEAATRFIAWRLKWEPGP